MGVIFTIKINTNENADDGDDDGDGGDDGSNQNINKKQHPLQKYHSNIAVKQVGINLQYFFSQYNFEILSNQKQ